jgi:formylglycine-generating enzyme required for sulfatase activity
LPQSPSHFKGAARPVESVSWEEAVEFCARLTQKTASLYRLPTEAEWEYACRAGTETPFHFGKTLTLELVNYDGKYPYGLCPKGSDRGETSEVEEFKAPNQFGLCDMHGNVWEWCVDWYGDYPSSEVKDPRGPATGSLRIFRGGGWDSGAANCRSATRAMSLPNSRSNNLGFRVVRTAP